MNQIQLKKIVNLLDEAHTAGYLKGANDVQKEWDTTVPHYPDPWDDEYSESKIILIMAEEE